jgi:lysophospholipase L1-like esterase
VSDPAPAKARRRPSTKRKALFAFVACALLLGVTEGAFQIREIVRSRRKPRLPTTSHEYLGIALIPGATYERKDQDRKMTINRLGMRGPEVSEKQAGKLRILCVGGSTTFGLYASSNETTWPARLEQQLLAAGKSVEVLNAGAPGWTSRASMTNLELRGFALQPDIVVVYHAYNDLMSNLEDAYVTESKIDDVEALRKPSVKHPLGWSALFRFMRSRIRSPHRELREKRDVLREVGAEAFARNLRRLIRRSREVGAKVMLCSFPTAYRDTFEASKADKVPHVELWYDSLCPITYPNLIKGMALYNERLRAVCAEAKAPLVDLAKTFPPQVELYHSPLHHSDAGEKRVAEAVAKALQREGWLP